MVIMKIMTINQKLNCLHGIYGGKLSYGWAEPSGGLAQEATQVGRDGLLCY